MTGEFNKKGLETSGNVTGVFLSSVNNAFTITGHTSGVNGSKIVFKASDGNSIYNGDKLQVSALQALCCIKT